MIINPFEVSLDLRTFTFVDRLSIDSVAEQDAVQQAIIKQLAAAQQDAMCAALGLPELEVIPNFSFGVYEGGSRVGIYMMAANQYISGPWADLVDWKVISSDPAILCGRHMPGFDRLSIEDEQSLSAETTWHFLSQELATAGGHKLSFERVSWAIFEGHTDDTSLRDIGVHNAIVADERLEATMVPDEVDSSLTRVDVELK